MRRAKWIALVAFACCTTAAYAAAVLEDRQESALAHETLPFYAKPDLRPRWDFLSRWRNVGGFHLTDQHGKSIDSGVLGEGPTIVSFFWSACLAQCPIAIEMLRAAKFKPRVLLISDQPLVDRPGLLAEYAKKLDLPADWVLATGRPEQVYGFARHGLFADIETRNPDGSPRHTETNYLVDSDGRLRGIYAAASPADAMRMTLDYARLVAEERNIPLVDDHASGH